MSNEQKRKKAICQADFLKAYRNGDPLVLEELVVVDANNECWDPMDLLRSLPPEETALTPEARDRRLRAVREAAEAAETPQPRHPR